MALTLQDMFTPSDRDTVLASLLQIAEDVGLPVEADAWQPGGVYREILVVVAQKLADLTEVTSAIAAGGLLDFASGGWLTLLAKSAFGVDRILKTFGTTTESMTNNSVTTYVIAAGDLHFLNATTGKTYTNTTGGTLTSGGGTLDVTIIADESGTDSNAVPGDIDSLVTPLLDVVVTNATALSATDDERDSDLKQRCRDKLAALSPNGAAAAYDYFAKSAVRDSDGSNVGVTRVKTTQTNGSVTVYVANASGPVSGTAGDPTTDLGAVNLLIQSKCVPTGITATVVSAAQFSLLVEADIYLKHGSSLDSTTAKQLVLEQLQDYFETIPIGGYDIGSGGRVFVAALTGQIFQAHEDIIDVVITTPSSDAVLNTNEVAVLTSLAASFTIHTT